MYCCSQDNHDINWEKELITERKFIVFERNLKDLLYKRQCDVPNCREVVDKSSVEEFDRFGSSLHLHFKCRVIINL